MKNPPEFSAFLLRWFSKNARDLPWRKTSDPYKIWVSEVMLQQTTVNAVIPYYKKWIKIFPILADVASAPSMEILKMWQGLGYYQRAKNLHRTAKIICSEYNRKIPADAKTLAKLPGFGPYTVGAVLSIAFNKREPIVDANIRRVVMRLLAIAGYPDTKHDKDILQFLNEAMPKTKCGIFNQALMELGALVCRNKELLCNMCPVKNMCRAYKKGIQEIIPKPKKRTIKKINVAVGLIKKREKYFIQKRSSQGLLADLWEFPGGKINPREKPRDALSRELLEELNVKVVRAKHFGNFIHFYTQYKVTLSVWHCDIDTLPKADKMHRWGSLKELKKYPMPSGDAKILDSLERSLSRI